jgi:hypothetical protein
MSHGGMDMGGDAADAYVMKMCVDPGLTLSDPNVR